MSTVKFRSERILWHGDGATWLVNDIRIGNLSAFKRQYPALPGQTATCIDHGDHIHVLKVNPAGTMVFTI
jgi:hypothetical protein